MITERWQQLLFGFYPASQLWRPPLALVVFLLAVMPILFSDLSRRFLWLSAAAPFLIFWLIWGGPIWGPLVVALGLAVALIAARWVARRFGALWGMLAMLAVLLVWFLDPLSWLLHLSDLVWLGLTGTPNLTAGSPMRGLLPLDPWLSRTLADAIPLGLPVVRSDDIGGFTLSFIIGLSGITLSLPLGILLALARRSDLWIVSKVAVIYIEVIRGVPLIVWLLVAQILLNYFLPPGTNFDILLRVVIMVTFFAAAYIAEVVRGGLAALPRGQFEAGDSLGLDYWQSMRLIVLPQALKISIPGIVNSFIGLLKDTTLVSIISMFDPMRLTSTIRATTSWGGIYWELYIFVAAVFFIVCFAMSRYSMWLERRLERSHR
jgi:general L-amino acid transport system permease protein